MVAAVRFRSMCMEVPDPEVLTEAMDEVLANLQKPAVVLIDAWCVRMLGPMGSLAAPVFECYIYDCPPSFGQY